MPENHYIDQYYVIEDLAAKGGMKIERYKDLGAALGAYYSLPNHKMKALGIENTAPLRGSLDFIQCKNGVDTLIYDCQEVESPERCRRMGYGCSILHHPDPDFQSDRPRSDRPYEGQRLQPGLLRRSACHHHH